MTSINCPNCGLALPGHARFCARCGAAQPGARSLPSEAPRPAVWVLVLFWLGTAGTLLVALTYGLVVILPEVSGQAAGDQTRIRLAAAVVTVLALALSGAQLTAAIGLTGGRSWGRVLGTLVCIIWCLTCIGLPFGLLALNSIWRSAGASRPAPSSQPGR